MFNLTGLNTMEMLTAHAQHVKINDLVAVHVEFNPLEIKELRTFH